MSELNRMDEEDKDLERRKSSDFRNYVDLFMSEIEANDKDSKLINNTQILGAST